MTIRNKSFASATTEDAVAANVNADVFNENNIPFAHATSVELLEQSSSEQLESTATAGGYRHLNNTTRAVQTPVAYSTGKPPQPPQQQQPRSSSVATGAPTSTHTYTIRRPGRCCCGITSVILLTILFVFGAWLISSPTL